MTIPGSLLILLTVTGFYTVFSAFLVIRLARAYFRASRERKEPSRSFRPRAIPLMKRFPEPVSQG